MEGRIILIEGPVQEPTGFDWTVLACQILWIGLMLVAPVILILLTLASPMLTLIALALGVAAFLMGAFSARNMLGAFQLIFRMGSWARAGGDTRPVRYLRVRESGGREHVVRMEGHLVSANVLLDDTVVIQGTWKRGVLHAKRGRNVRTGSAIRFRVPRAKMLLIVTLLVYVAIAAGLWVAHARASGLELP